MLLIVDAYNVLHVTGVLPADLAGIDLPGLVQLISQSRWRRWRVDLVCDGSAPAGVGLTLPGRIELRFAGPGVEADAVIERMIEQSSAPRRLTVVSSDRRLQRSARRRRSKMLSSEGFLRQLAADHGKGGGRRPSPPSSEPSMNEHSVADWIEAFGLDHDSELMRLQSAAGSSEAMKHDEPDKPGGHHLRNKTRRKRPADAPANLPESQRDELLCEAIRHWPGRIDWDDLDMRKWLDDARDERSESQDRQS